MSFLPCKQNSSLRLEMPIFIGISAIKMLENEILEAALKGLHSMIRCLRLFLDRMEFQGETIIIEFSSIFQSWIIAL